VSRLKFLVIFFIGFGVLASGLDNAVNVSSYKLIFDKVSEAFQKNFFDQRFKNLPVKPMLARYRNQIESPMDSARFKWIVNEFLSHFETSHTHFYDQEDQEYWAIKGIMATKITAKPVEQIEAWFFRQGKKWFVANIFDGGAAEKAGLLVGDEVVKAGTEAFHPLVSFYSKAGQKVELEIRRKKGGTTQKISVDVVSKSYPQVFEEAIRNSMRIEERGDRKIGYVHLWAATQPEHAKALSKAVEEMAPKITSMVLDLRDGYGGGDPSFIDLLFMSKDEKGNRHLRTFSKKLYVLVNENTTSGKEWMAALLKVSKRATLIGEKTAGAFLKASAFDIENEQFLLVIPTGKVPEDVQIEKNGISPNIKIKWKKPYSAGKDSQFNFAINDLAIN
jgi:carboxyl-terminal processing protease